MVQGRTGPRLFSPVLRPFGSYFWSSVRFEFGPGGPAPGRDRVEIFFFNFRFCKFPNSLGWPGVLDCLLTSASAAQLALLFIHCLLFCFCFPSSRSRFLLGRSLLPIFLTRLLLAFFYIQSSLSLRSHFVRSSRSLSLCVVFSVCVALCGLGCGVSRESCAAFLHQHVLSSNLLPVFIHLVEVSFSLMLGFVHCIS